MSETIDIEIPDDVWKAAETWLQRELSGNRKKPSKHDVLFLVRKWMRDGARSEFRKALELQREKMRMEDRERSQEKLKEARP